MIEIQLGAVEAQFADIIWGNEPISSSELVKKCEGALEWKKSTTFTVLRRLCQKGLFQNIDGTVSSVISREEYYAMQSERFVEENFKGSLPAFLAAFTARKNLSKEEIEELRQMVEEFQEG